jgi:hypothetical protein
VAVDRFTTKGGRFVRGRGHIVGPRQVEVLGHGVFEARRGIVLATGSTAAIPPDRGPGPDPVLDQPRRRRHLSAPEGTDRSGRRRGRRRARPDLRPVRGRGDHRRGRRATPRQRGARSR